MCAECSWLFFLFLKKKPQTVCSAMLFHLLPAATMLACKPAQGAGRRCFFSRFLRMLSRALSRSVSLPLAHLYMHVRDASCIPPTCIHMYLQTYASLSLVAGSDQYAGAGTEPEVTAFGTFDGTSARAPALCTPAAPPAATQ